jgi:hypothetical protein
MNFKKNILGLGILAALSVNSYAELPLPDAYENLPAVGECTDETCAPAGVEDDVADFDEAVAQEASDQAALVTANSDNTSHLLAVAVAELVQEQALADADGDLNDEAYGDATADLDGLNAQTADFAQAVTDATEALEGNGVDDLGSIVELAQAQEALDLQNAGIQDRNWVDYFNAVTATGDAVTDAAATDQAVADAEADAADTAQDVTDAEADATTTALA